MQKHTDVVQNRLGMAVEGAKVLVTDISGSVATIFSNNGTTQQTNPMTTNANGRFAFYAADGRYNLTITINNVQYGEQRDILLNDPADPSPEKIDGGVIVNSQVNDCAITGGTAQQVTVNGSTISQSELEDVTIDGLPPMTVGGQEHHELVEDVQQLTAQSREALRRSYADAGYNLVDGSFEEGGVLTSTDDVMITASGDGYSWAGTYPVGGYSVAPGTDPALSGSGYVPRTDVVLRSALAADDGAKLVGACPDIATLRTIEPETDRQSISVIGYYADTPLVGGGTFRYVASDTSSPDNGGSVIVTTGGKRWRRVTVGFFDGYSPKQFGCRGGSASGDTVKLQACISTGRVILDDVYKIESTITMPGGLHMVGIGHPVNCGFTGNLGTNKALSIDGSLQVGYLANFGMTGMTSGGLISMSNGSHMWRLDRILFRECVGPHIIYDNVWDTEFYNIHAIGGGSSTGNAVDQAVIVSKGDSNNNIIYGLRIEQPKNCGIYVGAYTDLRVIGGKIDCGFTGNQPANGGCEVYGALRLHDFLFAGFSVNKLKVYNQGSVLAENTLFGGGGGVTHIYWRPAYARIGNTAQGFRPYAGDIIIVGGKIEKVHSDVTTVVPYAFDFRGSPDTYQVRNSSVAAVASSKSVYLAAGTYSANDTDNKFYIAKKSQPRSVISKINTSYSTQQVNTAEAHGLSVGDAVVVLSAASEMNRITIDSACVVECNLFQEAPATSSAPPAVSQGETTVYSSYDAATYGGATGKYAVLSNGDAYLIKYAYMGNLTILGDVASVFASGTSFVVSTGAMLNAMQSQNRLFWFNGGTQKIVASRTIEGNGRYGKFEIFPFKD